MLDGLVLCRFALSPRPLAGLIAARAHAQARPARSRKQLGVRGRCSDTATYVGASTFTAAVCPAPVIRV
jgi:hypothetical protein